MGLEIHRILHAGYSFRAGETQILFDPIFENPFSHNCYAFPKIEIDRAAISRLTPSAIFISHYHDDHCSFESLNLLDRATPIYIFCIFAKMRDLLRELGFTQVVALELNEAIEVGPFRVTPRRAVQEDVDSLLQIQVDGLNILNVVDSELSEETLTLLLREPAWDLVLWPFQIMRETDVLDPRRALAPEVEDVLSSWAGQILRLNPRILVPSSCQFQMEPCSWYNRFYFATSYRRFSEVVHEVSRSATDHAEGGEGLEPVVPHIQRMNPGEGFRLSGSSFESMAPLEWIRPIGDQDIDYMLDLTFEIPSTNELARQMPSLPRNARPALFESIGTELPKRFAKIGAPSGVYFNRKMIWELVIHSVQGDASRFFFRLDGDEMTLVEQPLMESVQWLTEISDFKLHSALHEGEALNSLSVRVNDREYDLKTERKLVHADVMDDPLIRCLYNGDFASYQEHQLRRILGRSGQT